jgi:predicted acetyltransferase
LDSICLALFEGSRPVVCIQSTPMAQNVRGELFMMSAFWGLAAAPDIRRKGYARRVFTALLEAGQKDGHVFSSLYPFRESFYERLGYCIFPAPKLARLSTDALAPELKFNPGGEIRLVRIEKGLDDYRGFMKRRLGRTHGMAFYDKPEAISENLRDQWLAEAWFNDRLQGIMVYEIQGTDDDQGKFQFSVSRLDYETSEAKYQLLQWIALHIDQADRVTLLLPPDERPEIWLADTKVKIELYEAPMARVLDIQGLNGLPAGDGKFSVLIHDPACPWNEGGWRFETVKGKLRVDRDAHATEGLSIQGLTALVFGSHDPREFACRGWGELSSVSLKQAEQMFPPANPFLDEMF